MKRRLVLFIRDILPKHWYRAYDRLSVVQANCPRCKKWKTAVRNDRCSDCIMFEALDQMIKDKWGKKEQDGRLA